MFPPILGIEWNALLTPPGVYGVGGMLIVVIAIIVPQWRQVHQTSALARLTRDMIDRGFSADEIERVLNAGARIDRRTHRCCEKAPRQSGAQTALTE